MPLNRKRLTVQLGTRFGNRRVIRIRFNREQQWLMQCDCGDKSWATASRVNSGKSKSCGRCHIPEFKVGTKFKDRRILAIRMSPANATLLLLECECGTKNWARAFCNTGSTCKKCAVTAEAAKRRLPVTVGQSFGKRVVTGFRSSISGRQASVRCVCGNESWSGVSSLLKGDAMSCPSCCAVLNGHRRYRPNLTQNELDELLGLKILEKNLLGFLEAQVGRDQ